jgi:hypothetical protein
MMPTGGRHLQWKILQKNSDKYDIKIHKHVKRNIQSHAKTGENVEEYDFQPMQIQTS